MKTIKEIYDAIALQFALSNQVLMHGRPIDSVEKIKDGYIATIGEHKKPLSGNPIHYRVLMQINVPLFEGL